MEIEIRNQGPEEAIAFGWRIQKGYVYQLDAADESAWECSAGEGLFREGKRFGYHGSDVPPCGADYLYADGSELLVISDESDSADIDTVKGFTLTPIVLEAGDHRHDGTWEFRVLAVKSDGETTLAGKC